MKELLLPRPLVVKLLTEAQARPDGTVRGLIGARGGVPETIRLLDNEREALFDVPQQELHEAVADLASDGELLYAIFESRPTAVQPAAEDLQRIDIRGLLYLVISLGTRGVLEMQGWKLLDGEPVAVEIGIRELD